jgi:protein gp37
MGMPQYKDGFKLTLQPEALKLPHKWKKPRIIFVNSMSDLFHEDVPFEYIRKVFEVMNDTPYHTHQFSFE